MIRLFEILWGRADAWEGLCVDCGRWVPAHLISYNEVVMLAHYCSYSAIKTRTVTSNFRFSRGPNSGK